jgi:murein L,D-transpeptidase YafK
MRNATSLLALVAIIAAPLSSPPQERKSFREQQSSFSRVREAAKEKDAILRKRFAQEGLEYPPGAIFLRAFKSDALLELWVRNDKKKEYSLEHTYTVCTSSGTLGPKRRYGDEQVPEGFYTLDWFNPQSNFYLSMHISYPNASDRILGSRVNPGGDIFLHGNCASIGCIPITDDGIKEVYWLAVLAKTAGQKEIPIEIFPSRLTDDRFKTLAAMNRNRPDLVAFWANLKEGFDYFERNRRPPRLGVRGDGKYAFRDEIAAGGQH